MGGKRLGILALTGLLMTLGCQRGASTSDVSRPPPQQTCRSSDTGLEMSLVDARANTQGKACAGMGTLTDKATCDEAKSQWLLFVDATNDNGCQAACAVDVRTGFAETRWVCPTDHP